MSGLYNIRIGGVEAEDIICDGQAVEEVWVDGVQVFDAYDPDDVPAGTMQFDGWGSGWPGSYPDAVQGFNRISTNGQAGAIGHISLSTGQAYEYYYRSSDSDTSYRTDKYYTQSGKEVNWAHSVSTTMGLYYADGRPLFYITSYDRCGVGSISGDEMSVGGAVGATIVNSNANFHGTKSARIDWNFKTRKVTISGGNNFTTVTRDFSQKWRPGMYVRVTRNADHASTGWYVYYNSAYQPSYNIYTTSHLFIEAYNDNS